VHRAALDLRKGLSHFEAQVSHFSTGTAALFGRRLQLALLTVLVRMVFSIQLSSRPFRQIRMLETLLQEDTNVFKKLGPQKVQHVDGYIVQIADRSTVEYIEGKRLASIEVDFASVTGVYKKTLRGCGSSENADQMGHEEGEVVLQRIIAGIRAMGCNVEVC